MKYDLSNPRSLPMSLDGHVVIQLATGATFTSNHLYAGDALLKVISENVAPEEISKLPEAEQKKFVEAGMDMVFGRGGAAFQKMRSAEHPGILEVCGFATWDEPLPNKNAVMICEAGERLTSDDPHAVRGDEKAIFQRVRKDLETQFADPEREQNKNASDKDPIDELFDRVFGGQGIRLGGSGLAGLFVGR